MLVAIQLAVAPKPCFAAIERISAKDLKEVKEAMPEQKLFQKDVLLAPGVVGTARIEVTAKGNGNLHLVNLNLKVFDCQDDGRYYENGLLIIDFVDLDKNGKRGLVISGVVCFRGEKTDTVLRREAIVFIYRLGLNIPMRKFIGARHLTSTEMFRN